MEEEHFLWSIRLVEAEDGDQSAGEDADEVSQGEVKKAPRVYSS